MRQCFYIIEMRNGARRGAAGARGPYYRYMLGWPGSLALKSALKGLRIEGNVEYLL